MRLDRDRKGQRFRDRTEADSSQGTLEPFAGRTWRWSVPGESVRMIGGACFGFGRLKARDQIEEFWREPQAKRGS